MTHYTVIGSSGFVGKRVVEFLQARGENVFSPGREGNDLPRQDLGRVIYCAGLTGDYRCRPFAAVEAHVSLLARVLDHSQFDRIVYLSSTRLYQHHGLTSGRETDSLVFAPANPEHLYELSKALGENLALRRSAGRGSVARLSYVFDERDGATGFLSEWLAQARSSRELTIDSVPESSRDYIHLDDVAAALCILADSEINDVVNIASGRMVSNREIANVFEGEGWSVAFQGQAPVSHGVTVDVERLHDLGLHPRHTLDCVRHHLRKL